MRARESVARENSAASAHQFYYAQIAESMAARYLKSLERAEFKDFLESFDVVLSDCDGVLWREKEVISGSPETVAEFRKSGKKFFYITNNNCKTREDLVDKCRGLAYDATVDDVLCASYLAAVYLKERNFTKKVYLIGGDGIAREFDAQGIKYCGVGPDEIVGDELDLLMSFKRDPEVGAVVIGFDKHLSYPKFLKAATYAQDRDNHFIGTNPDTERPSPNGNVFPGAGAYLLGIEAAAGRKAVVLGKPEPFVSELIAKKYGVNPARTLMIGDNLNTDILLGKRCGFTTLLVMSGIATKDDLDKQRREAVDPIIPDFYADQLSDVLDCLALQRDS